MLVIRDEQIHALRQESSLCFEQRMIERVRADFPQAFDFLGEAGIKRLIRLAMARAETLEIRSEGAVTVLIELVMQFGERFERSPDRQWVEKMLAHPVLPDYIRVGTARDRLMARTGGRTLDSWGGKAARTVVGANG